MGSSLPPGRRTLQHARTSLAPGEVLAAARQFFLRRNTIYPAFLEQQGPSYLTFRGPGGEEVVIGVAGDAGVGTSVTGSTYMFDGQVARFFSTLPPRDEGAAPE
jgi:hypothetical protein